MARGLLKPRLDMVITAMDMAMDMVMDMAMDILDTDMVVMDTMAIMARGPLMLSQDMDMAMVMDTMVKQICCSFLEFSTNEVGLYRSSQNTPDPHLPIYSILKPKK